MFNNYEEYINYVGSTFNEGGLEELKKNKLVEVELFDGEIATYRILTEEEFQRLNEK